MTQPSPRPLSAAIPVPSPPAPSRHALDHTAGQLQVVRRCHDYAVLDMHDRVGFRLDPATRRTLRALRRLLEGDAVRHRRGHRRLPVLLPLTVTPQGQAPLSGQALNISGGGLFAVLPEALPVGTNVAVQVASEPGSDVPPAEFFAEVRWSRPQGGPVGHGLRFSAMPVQRATPTWSVPPAA